jgi:hypothetical protein
MYGLPYTPETIRKDFRSHFAVNGIPMLIVLDSEGNLVSRYGRNEAEEDPEGCVDLWIRISE